MQINSREHYEDYETLREIYRNDLPGNLKPVDRLEKEKQFIRNAEAFEKESPEKAMGMLNLASEYRNLLQKFKISDAVVKQKNPGFRAFGNAFLCGITLPVFLYGWLNFFLGFHLPSMLIRKKIKDVVFWATVEYVAWIIFIPVFALIQWGVFWVVSGNFLHALIYLVSLPLFGKLALNLRDFYLKTIRQMRLVSVGSTSRFQIKKLRKEILNIFGQMA
jgi:hypothetical protein